MRRSAVEQSVRVVTLDRPTRMNALTPDGLDKLKTTFEDATEPVVYLHGTGERFCAGANLDVVSSGPTDWTTKRCCR